MTSSTQLSRFLALILRHEPDQHGLALDSDGFAALSAVWRAVQTQFPGVYTLADLLALGETPPGKRRFEFKDSPPRMRALYGHSSGATPVEYVRAAPPEFLFHGTTVERAGRIRKQGLLPGRRQYVHLTTNLERARSSAARHRDAQPVILSIRAGAAHRAGIAFYHPEQEHFLAAHVPPQFIDFPSATLTSEADWLRAAVQLLPEQTLLVVDRSRQVRAAAGIAMLAPELETAWVVGRALDQVLTGDRLAGLERLIDETLQGDSQAVEESEDGLTRLYRSYPLRDTAGDVFAVVILMQDVSDQRRIEHALRESQRFVERVTATMPDAVYVYDLKQRRSIYNNREIAHVLGYTPQEITDMGATVLQQLVHPDDYPRQQSGESRFMQAGDGDIIESQYRMRHADGSWRWINMRDTVFLRDAEGRTQQILGVAQDVTERLAAQQAALDRERLLVALQKEQELSHLKTSLMQRISHEFRTPLAIIQTGAELLGRYLERLSTEQRLEQIDRIKHEIKHLAAMLDDLSLVVSGNIISSQPNLKVFDLTQDVQHLTTRFGHVARHAIVTHLPEQAVLVQGDRQMIHTLINNLLSNATKFSSRDTPVTVRLSECDPLTREVELVVADQGIGIPASDLAQVTEPFFRGSNIGEISGIGIGLTVVRLVVEAHGGSIAIDSLPGAGTRVTVRLPIGSTDELT